jgi:hypothetical protein
MQTRILAFIFATALWCGALAQADLTINGEFDSGETGWSTWVGGKYFYTDGADSIASIGWWNAASIWQDTTAKIEAGVSYALTVRARVGEGPLTGIKASFQDVTTGWTRVAEQTFTFPAEEQALKPGPWHTFSINIDSSVLAGRVGDSIGVGVEIVEQPDTQYGWLHLDSIKLTAVPEPSSVALLSLGTIGLLALRRRK